MAMLLAPCAALAAEEALVMDRPDFVESSQTVGTGRVQLETSMAFERGKQDGVTVKSWSTPSLLRVGFAKDWEARIETDGRGRVRIDGCAANGGVSASGWNDVSIGVKWHVQHGDEKRRVASTALLVHADLDSGSGAFRANGVRPSVRYVVEWELPDEQSVGVMPGVFSAKDANASRFTGGIFAVTVGKAFTETFRGFVEVSGEELVSKRHGGNVANVRGGVAYLIGNDMQIDAAVAGGLTRESPDVGIAAGFSLRF